MATLHQAYVANDASNQLFVINSSNGTSWSGHFLTNASSAHAPALAMFNGQLWMAFVDNPPSNRGMLVIRSIDGTSWSGNFRFPLTGQRTKAAPALAAFNDQLWIAYVADNPSSQLSLTRSRTNVESASHGGPLPPEIAVLFTPTIVTGHSSKAAPALAVFNGQLWMAYLANDPSNQLFVINSPDGTSWSDDFLTHRSSKAAPALAVFNGQLWMAYLANDPSNQLFVINSPDGTSWSGGFVTGHSSKAAPALAVFNGQLWMAYVANDPSNQLFVINSSNGTSWPSDFVTQHSSQTAPALILQRPPIVTGLDRREGKPGDLVVVSGTGLSNPGGFRGATEVAFGSVKVPAGDVTGTDTRLTVKAPAGGTGTVAVTVTTTDGTSPITEACRFTYIAAPRVDVLDPRTGKPTDLVVVSGTGLSNPTEVAFGSVKVPAGDVTGTDTRLTVKVPTGGTGTVPVIVTTAGGTSPDTPACRFTYIAAPRVDVLDPRTGKPTDLVVVSGTGLSNPTEVAFGSVKVPAGDVTGTDTRLTVKAPAGGTGTVPVIVTTAGGTSPDTPACRFTYIAAPRVDVLDPRTGKPTDLVVVSGTGLSNPTEVAFGSVKVPAGDVTGTDTRLTVKVPTGGTGTVPVIVTTAGGTSPDTPACRFTYIAAPRVDVLDPRTGKPTDLVVVSGTGLSNPTEVAFGSVKVPAGDVTGTDTRLTVKVPTGGTGTVPVIVTTAGGTSPDTPACRFTYIAAPRVDVLDPRTGKPTDLVVVSGTGLSNPTEVAFGSVKVPAGDVTGTDTRLTVKVPTGGTGTVPVIVTTAGGTSPDTPACRFTYIAAPRVDVLDPRTGKPTDLVVVSGTGLSNPTEVAFGSVKVPAGDVTGTDTRLTVKVPTGGTGTVPVIVTTAGGTSPDTPACRFTYIAAPRVDVLDPRTGKPTDLVVVSGTGLSNPTEVAFGSVKVPAGDVTGTDTRLTVKVPTGGTGTVPVIVTTAGGTSPETPACRFTYIPRPTVRGLDPHGGKVDEQIIVRGTDLSGSGRKVFFGKNESSQTVDLSTGTRLRVKVPNGSGMVDVTVETRGGTSEVTAACKFTYE